MKYSKRQFLKQVAGLSVLPLDKILAAKQAISPEALASDELFWQQIGRQYAVTSDFIQLENGYYALAAQEVLEAYLGHIQRVNRESSYYMRTRQFDDKRVAQTQLAGLLGCEAKDLIITRNTTESLDTVIAGLDWKPGDQALMAAQDYGAMLDMFKLQARRLGIQNQLISLPNHPSSDEEIVALYEKAITPRTRLLMVCHLVNITGQILPIRKITEMAHRHGVLVMVDGAHTFGQLSFTIKDLGGCDFYASSLHKWLGSPLGAGILYVRPDRVASIWPLFGDANFADTDLRKLNHTGTHPVATDLAIQDAIRFHQKIGVARKEARLRYLQRYWTDQVRALPRVVLNTPSDPKRSCAIANVGIEGMDPGKLAEVLMQKYRIFTVAIGHSGVFGVRVTPHLYTTTTELDVFVNALKELSK
jgi:selenocysteine lyase/cysteine desulfurase